MFWSMFLLNLNEITRWTQILQDFPLNSPVNDLVIGLPFFVCFAFWIVSAYTFSVRSSRVPVISSTRNCWAQVLPLLYTRGNSPAAPKILLRKRNMSSYRVWVHKKHEQSVCRADLWGFNRFNSIIAELSAGRSRKRTHARAHTKSWKRGCVTHTFSLVAYMFLVQFKQNKKRRCNTFYCVLFSHDYVKSHSIFRSYTQVLKILNLAP